MSNKKTDWKSKYYELRARYMSAIDVSFRLGFQEGSKASQIQNMETQLQQAQQQAAMAAQAGAQDMGGEGLPPEAMGGEGLPPEEGGEGLPPEEGGEGLPPEEGGEGLPPEAMGGEEIVSDQGNDELDAGIQGLESLVSKSEKVDFTKMMKSFYKNTNNTPSSLSVSDKEKKVNDIIKKWET